MSDEPATYIRGALSSLELECRSLRITHHDPQLFGNLVAEAETDRGSLQITYDRGFYVEVHGWSDGALTADRIAKALEQHMLAASNVR